jgi:hypothetical protein
MSRNLVPTRRWALFTASVSRLDGDVNSTHANETDHPVQMRSEGLGTMAHGISAQLNSITNSLQYASYCMVFLNPCSISSTQRRRNRNFDRGKSLRGE